MDSLDYKIIIILIVTVMFLICSYLMIFSRLSYYKRIVQSEQQFDEEKKLFNGMLALIDTLVIVLKPNGNVHFLNTAFEKIIGIKIDENYCKSKDIYEIFEEETVQSLIQGFQYVSKNKTTYVIQNQLLHKKNGQEIILRICMDYIEIGDKSYIILTANDLTREVQLAKVKDIVIRLNNMISKYHSLDDYFDDILRSLVGVIPYAELGSILLIDENNYMTMRANVGYNSEDVKQFKMKFEESFFFRCSGENKTSPIIINDLAAYSMKGVTSILDNIKGIEVASSLSSPIIIDGKLRGLLNLDSSKNHIFNNEDLEIMQFLIEQISMVLTSHQLLNETIYLSRFDQLTGLYNRWYLNELESSIIPHSLRYKEHFYYVMMDVNNLKMVNDIYGHISGDTYLKEFSMLLKKHSRKTDILIRIGGDEFVGVFFEIDKELLISTMQMINEELKVGMEKLGIYGDYGFAFGVTRFPEESQILDDFIKIADQRMYEKKKEMKKIE